MWTGSTRACTTEGGSPEVDRPGGLVGRGKEVVLMAKAKRATARKKKTVKRKAPKKKTAKRKTVKKKTTKKKTTKRKARKK